MIEVKEVLTRRQRRDFLEFPNRLYKGNEWYVPALMADERKIFRKDYLYYDVCEAVYFNAYKDGKMAGRISGILQKLSNEIRCENRIRFTRFDCIEDFEVARALFEAVEQWGRQKGMSQICGPLGFSDFEREGLLIEGFDQPCTFEEQYNYPYYQEFIEKLGYAKEVDWVESQIYKPDDRDFETLKAASEFVMKRFKLRVVKARTTKEFLDKYIDSFFEVVDRSYADIYGAVPFTEGMKKLMRDNFELIIDNRYVLAVVDENDKMVLIGICFPALSKAARKAGGRISPGFVKEYLKVRRKSPVLDLGLIGVVPEWSNRGVSAICAYELAKMLQDPEIHHAETNLNLEDNDEIRNLWKRFNSKENKRRRAYLKAL